MGTGGFSGTCGCPHCTVSKKLKHVVRKTTTNQVTLAALGKPRTRQLNKRVMKAFELAVRKHLRENQKEYEEYDGDFDIDDWLMDGKLHLEDHPASGKGGLDSFIKTYARETAFNYVSLMTYDHDERSTL